MGDFIEPTRTTDGRRLRRSEREHATLLAHVDEPESNTVDAQDSTCWFVGWVASARGKGRVLARAGDSEPVELTPSLARPDVVDALAPRFAVADTDCGFCFPLQLPPKRRGRRRSVRLEFTDGTLVAHSPRYRVRHSSRSARARGEYRQVWEALAGDLDAAKWAVACCTDERRFEETGRDTLAMLDQTVGIGPEDVVLEIGCGVGRVGRFVAPRCRKWIGTDVSERMLEQARQRLVEFDNVELIAISGWDLSSIPAASVDVVYCTVVFMHLDEWDRYAYVREAFRVLRPGGRFLVDNFNLTTDDGWALFLREATQHHPVHRPPQISKASTPQELETYLGRAGFANVELRTGGTWILAFGRRPPVT